MPGPCWHLPTHSGDTLRLSLSPEQGPARLSGLLDPSLGWELDVLCLSSEPALQRVLEAVYQGLTGQRAAGSDSPFELGGVRWRQELQQTLRRAVSGGQLDVERVEQPQVNVQVVRPSELPGSSTREANDEALTSDFEVRLVDDAGVPLAGVELEFSSTGKRSSTRTDSAGVARFSSDTASFGAVRVLRPNELEETLEARWATPRKGPRFQTPQMRALAFSRDLPAVSVESRTPLTIVLQPELGHLHVELWDKAGRARHVGVPYRITGALELEGTTDARGRLHHTEVPAGDYTLQLELETSSGAEVKRVEHSVPLVVLPTTLAAPQVRRVGLSRRPALARISGGLFETNKSFLLPAALPTLRELGNLYAWEPDGQLLVVGHTDVTGEQAVNEPLSLERAEVLAAFLRDEVEAWLDYYGDHSEPSRRWGAVEDRHMLSALGVLDECPAGDPVRWFQRSRALKVDGVAGPKTRRQLVTEYMQLDEASLVAEDVALEVTTHGCGGYFPAATPDDAPSDDAAPDAAADQESGASEPLDRRVELFFFPAHPGITPAPSGQQSSAGSTQYARWRDAATVELDVSLDARRRVVLMDELGAPLPYEPYELLTADGGRVAGVADERGVIALPPGLGTEVTLRLIALAPEVQLAAS